jgi:hypothetical protein
MADRTPEQTRSLALERMAALLDQAWLDRDGPMLKGIWGRDDSQDVIDELVRMTNGIQAESAANPTATMVWEVVCGGLPNYEWWERFQFSDGSDWNIPGTLSVTVENPQGGESITKELTALDMLHTYLKMPNRTHCGGCDLIGDPDACSSDLILQWTFFGEEVYA